MNLKHLVTLSLLPKSVRYAKPVETFFTKEKIPSIDDILHALDSELKLTDDLEVQIFLAEEKAKRITDLTESLKIRTTHFWADDFPQRLRMIEHPPMVLFYYGSIHRIGVNPVLSVVGSRVPTIYGAKLIERVLGVLDQNEVEHVSGLAHGIDSLAHHRTLLKGIRNYAILGCGLDDIFPKTNESLARDILLNGGALISEYPVYSEPKAHHFPWRNRIIAGLADVIWIPEATAKSGTRHTVDHALKCGKKVCATPGDIDREQTQLPNQILRDGGHTIIDHDDLRMHLSPFARKLKIIS